MNNWQLIASSGEDYNAFASVIIDNNIYIRGYDNIYQLNIEAGGVIWSHLFKNQKPMATNALIGNKEGVFTYEEHKNNKEYTTTFYWFSLSGEVLWKKTLPYVPYKNAISITANNTLLMNGVSYGEDSIAIVELDIKTGEVVFHQNHSKLLEFTFFYENKRVFLGSDGCYLFKKEESDKLTLLSEDRITEIIINAKNHLFYISEADEVDEYYLKQLDISSQKLKILYTFENPDTNLGPLISSNQKFFYLPGGIDEGEGLQKINLETSKEVWSINNEDWTFYNIINLQDHIVASIKDKTKPGKSFVIYIDKSSGKVLGKIDSMANPSDIYSLNNQSFLITGTYEVQLIRQAL
ncbi:hypothetical protein [uncultured Microscilla sp.]|uniref:hypothetical protein n=1 Tax=uncultured Microscilla sp. TaxID=432653 RepID=UPI002618FFBB|nr:hypothetical protein [uncultured Microscilla sp.]